MSDRGALDVVVVGAGPAGLSAALLLGRCRRRALVCEGGEHRNAASHALHGFLTRDGTAPTELLRLGREGLRRYDTVELRETQVVEARREHGGFEVVLADGATVACRKLLLATGVVDELPRVPGFDALYGRSAFHCPYCDGWEVRDRPLAVYGRGQRGKGLALELTGWSRDVLLMTDGPAELDARDRERLERSGIAVREERIERLEGTDGQLARVVLATGEALPRQAVFFNIGETQRSDLAARLGCTFTPSGDVWTSDYEATSVPGVYVAGDAGRLVQLAIVAASEGALAAFAINSALLREDLRQGPEAQ